jgi:hypothetical protein
LGYDQARKNFLLACFSIFVPSSFQKDAANGFAQLQIIPIKNRYKWTVDEASYVAFKFTLPSWNDGDLKFLFAINKTEQTKDFTSSKTQFGLMSADGYFNGTNGLGGFDNYQHAELKNYPMLQKMLPYSHTFDILEVKKNHLQPGKTYAIWFALKEENHPGLVVAATIDSQTGTNEFGMLPL